jgi:hypothetical protein
MATTSFTIEQLQALESAIAQGTLRVKYGDKEVEYRSLSDMLRLLDLMRRELGLVPKGSGKVFASFNKGIL